MATRRTSKETGTGTKRRSGRSAAPSTRARGRTALTRTRKRVRPPAPPATDRIVRRRSTVHGWGVFAIATIPKNKRIVDYAGEKVRAKDSIARQERQLASGHIWCFELNRAWVIDAEVGGNIARFINHACKPNCYVEIDKGIIWIRAARTIAVGEELTYDYHTDGDETIQCRCRPGCKRML